MTYLSWAALYEGESDAAYFDVLIPRMMEDIIMTRGTRYSTIPAGPVVRLRRQDVEKVAREACMAKDAFHLVFIHADTGGRGLGVGAGARSDAYCDAMQRICAWPPARCVTILPRPETESWVLSDPAAVTAALGYTGSPDSIGLPATAAQAGQLPDPKAALEAAVGLVRGRRGRLNVNQLFAAIAQRQNLPNLRGAPSFAAFESRLSEALADLGSI